jgi:L-asparaginase
VPQTEPTEQTEQMRRQHVVVVLGTGGTISGRAARSDDLVAYTAGEVSVADLVSELGGQPGSRLESEQVAQVDSKDMDLQIWQRLCDRVRHHLARPEVCGLVITHGTDTIEETAYLLQALLGPTKPVVLTCAMRPATALAPDGPQNLADALVLARHAQAQGVMVVCAGKIHGPADVTKVHTYRTDAFDSGDAGPLGVIEHGQVRLWRPWPSRGSSGVTDQSHRLTAFQSLTALPRVELIFSHACADGLLVRSLLGESPVHGAPRLLGLVVAGTGNGSLHRLLKDVLGEAQRAGVRVVRSSRCAYGRVQPAEGDVLENMAGLSPVKARLALALDLMEA